MIPFDATGATSQPCCVVLLVSPIGPNWTGLMEQDVSCFPSDALTVLQTSLQPGLSRLHEPQFTITQGRNRRSQRITSGVSPLSSLLSSLFIIWPSLFAVPLADKLSKTHSRNSKKCSFGELRGAILPIQGSGKKNIFFASDLPGEVKGGGGGAGSEGEAIEDNR